MIVLMAKITIRLPYVHSLKEKRSVLNKLKSRLANRFGASVREVGSQDRQQWIELGLSYTALQEQEARDVIDRLEQTLWHVMENEGELVSYETKLTSLDG